MNTLFDAAFACLMVQQADAKAKCAASLWQQWQDGKLVPEGKSPPQTVAVPGHPDKPQMVAPGKVERRRLATLHGQAALIHALAHIEFNAINLALDAAYRFRGMPQDFYRDWLQVAAEEAFHFMLLRDHLHTLGYDYGDFTAHNGLWEMAVKTAHDPMIRMALVPRLLEARGLDVTPGISARLASCGDQRAVEILAIIQRDEVGHVSIGNRWYGYLCRQRGLDPIITFRSLLAEYDAPALRPPFNMAARAQAGFNPDELGMLEDIARKITD
ncbi:MAG: ferritin-like domain-containing protein [Gammaproteobacteria bacterium]|nr:ferritin-like domain-containing protein [Gammaproteobacteria bacterium]MBU1733185.1 ferritin-like domain-containing protein [Gammaproteobacteria bacterium]MBU1892233.1 ferritin-like domain-containing protein [Gammaproteobacteria bacterium]